MSLELVPVIRDQAKVRRISHAKRVANVILRIEPDVPGFQFAIVYNKQPGTCILVADLAIAVKDRGTVGKMSAAPVPIAYGFSEPSIIQVMVVVPGSAKCVDVRLFPAAR